MLCFLATVNKVAVGMEVQIYLWHNMKSSGYLPSSEIVGS